jgi:hypothetical protein
MDRKYKDVEDTEYKEVEILTNAVHTPDIRTASVPKRTRVCGFEPNTTRQENSGLGTPVADMVEELIVAKRSFRELTDSQIAFLQWLIIRGSKHKRGKGRMVIVDDQTINQYVLEVLAIRRGFDKSKNYAARFKRFIKVLSEEGYLIRDQRLQNYYLINPGLVSTSSTAQAKK